MTETFRTVSPVDQSVVAERTRATGEEIERAVALSVEAFEDWKKQDLQARQEVVGRFVDLAVRDVAAVAEELTTQIGRPIRDGASETRGWLERGHAMLRLAPDALADLALPEREGFTRFIRHEPLGPVFVLAPWNYPWLTSVNALVPALVAGNTVVVKHSEQTPLVAERMADAAKAAGFPRGVFQTLQLSHSQVGEVIADSRIAFVAFTGSVEGGHAVLRAASRRLIGASLELGGKDAAYVCSDADIVETATNLCDGAFYNAGQSCCAIERIYVERGVYRDFLDAFTTEARKLVLGDPRETTTSLGPVVRVKSAEWIATQTEEAIRSGATALLRPEDFPESERGLPYLAPQVLVDVDHGMDIMTEETFGPVVGIMPVDTDLQAVAWMNHSRYGLTASIWTGDIERAQRIGERVAVGTWFMNRCDYLDPELAWVGVKDSGRGCSLSKLGYAQLTRPKSFHLRHRPA